MNIDKPYLVLIKDSIDQIFFYLNGKGKEFFLNNDLLKDACLSRLIVIGEYSVKISQATKDRFSEVEWQQIKVARNFYVHAYGQLNWELIWDTIQIYLPELKPKIENIIEIIEKEDCRMQSLTNRSKQVERKPMNFWERMYLPSIFKGMAITFSHLFKKNPTISYPEEKRPFSAVFRGVQILNRDEEGRERCTACGLCVVACPAEAITMEAAERQPGEEHLYKEEKYAAKYEINMLRCIFCGLCEEACPKDAVYLTQTFAPSNYDRKGFIYGKDDLLIPNPVTQPGEYAKAKGTIGKEIK